MIQFPAALIVVSAVLGLGILAYLSWRAREEAHVWGVLVVWTGLRSLLLCSAVTWLLAVLAFFIAGSSPWRCPDEWPEVAVVLSGSLGGFLAVYLVLGVGAAVALNITLVIYDRQGKVVRDDKAKLKTRALVKRWALVHRILGRWHGARVSDLMDRVVDDSVTTAAASSHSRKRRGR